MYQDDDYNPNRETYEEEQERNSLPGCGTIILWFLSFLIILGMAKMCGTSKSHRGYQRPAIACLSE